MIDPKVLRSMTDAAITRAKREREEALAKEREEAERARKAAEMKADQILDQVPERCATEAKAGRSHAIVMSLAYKDFDGRVEYIRRHVKENLVGAAAIVNEKLVQAGFATKIEFWDNSPGGDGFGQNGHNLIVTW